jgi:hypothetical protein
MADQAEATVPFHTLDTLISDWIMQMKLKRASLRELHLELDEPGIQPPLPGWGDGLASILGSCEEFLRFSGGEPELKRCSVSAGLLPF